MNEKPKIVIFGAGAIGGSVGGWIADKYDGVHFLDKGPVADALRNDGLIVYISGEKGKAKKQKVKVISDIAEVSPPDVIVVAVKNYSLDGVAKMIRDKVGDTPIILSLQNGIENQQILPKYFSKVIYGVVSYNAWLDAPGVVGAQKRGPLIIGTVNNELQSEMETISEIFNKGIETVVTPHLQDAARSKMIINLTNSLTTLVGHGFREISDPPIFQKLLSNLTYEGVRIIKGAGYKECKLGGMPSWILLEAAAKLPQFITRGLFEKNVKKMVMSSMAQDIIQRGGTESELESLNGYFINLADRRGLKVPYNRAIYELCKQEFGKPDFKPIDVSEVWAKVQEKMGA